MQNQLFYLIRFIPTNQYAQLTDQRGRPRIICFDDIDTSHRCVEQLCKHRSKYGQWPDVDLSRRVSAITQQPLIKKRTPIELLDYFEQEEITNKQLDQLARTYNIFPFLLSGFRYRVN